MSVSLGDINQALAVLCRAAEVDQLVLDSRVSGRWETLGKSQQHYYKQKTQQLVHIVGELVAPGQGHKLLEAADVADAFSTDEHAISSDSSPLLDNLVHVYSASQTWQEKRKLLSIFCGLYTKEKLQEIIPGLTSYAISAARQHAEDIGVGADIPAKTIIRSRLSEDQVDHFLDFLSDPMYLKTCSYGSREITLSSGDQLEIPNVIRPIMACHLVDCYSSYCEETHFVPLPRSSLFRVLNDCQASYSKNLQGLDNISAQGMEGFAILELTAKQLQIMGETTDWHKSVLNKLNFFKEYLKYEFRSHINLFDKCAYHCMAYGLSDPKDAAFQLTCNHQHGVGCSGCEALHDVQLTLSSAVEKLKDIETKKELQHDLQSGLQYIEDYRTHIMRSVNQDRYVIFVFLGSLYVQCTLHIPKFYHLYFRCRLELLDSLQHHQAVIVMDWAMKFLPAYFREKQQDFFGKRGKSWHVSVVIHLDDKKDMKVRVLTKSKKETNIFYCYFYCTVQLNNKASALHCIKCATICNFYCDNLQNYIFAQVCLL
jgi:hypothetical protein